jgi:hypothetical protein
MSKYKLSNILAKIISLAKENNILASEVKLTQLNEAGISERQLRHFGGLIAIKKAHFPDTEKELSDIAELKETSKYINSLESKLSKKEFLDSSILNIIKDKLQPLPIPKNQQTKAKPNKTKRVREVVAMLNDTHYGLIVNAEEVDGLNQFSWTEACRRTAYFIKEVNDYKPHTRDETKKLHLILNGDLINGIIHGLTSRTMELWVHQMNGALHILTHAIHSLSGEFNEIEVHGIGGNHEELPHKREHGKRATQEHYDNFSNAMFYSLSVAFRQYKNIKFNFPKTPYLFMNLPAGRAMVCHGHNMFSRQLGNPGTSINVKSLSAAIREFNAGEQLKGREPVKLVLFGHTHTYAHFITVDGVEVYVAPSLSGIDGFAHQLTINTNFIGQVVFESTKEFILGDSRLIRLKDADTDKELDTIIPVYKNELKIGV